MDPYERRVPRTDDPKPDATRHTWGAGGGVQPSWRKEEARPGDGPATQAWRPNELKPTAPPAPPPTEAVRRPAQTPATDIAKDESARPPVQVRRLRRGRLAIRKVSPWSTFKFSLVFYFCMLLIMLLGTAIIFAALKAFGVVGSLENLLEQLDFNVTISGGLIFRWFFLIGLVGTLVASAITVFMAFLYNLIADVVGGIEILVTERE